MSLTLVTNENCFRNQYERFYQQCALWNRFLLFFSCGFFTEIILDDLYYVQRSYESWAVKVCFLKTSSQNEAETQPGGYILLYLQIPNLKQQETNEN